LIQIEKRGELYFILIDGEAVFYADLDGLARLLREIHHFVPESQPDPSPLEVI
jgi:hypothetical protein